MFLGVYVPGQLPSCPWKCQSFPSFKLPSTDLIHKFPNKTQTSLIFRSQYPTVWIFFQLSQQYGNINMSQCEIIFHLIFIPSPMCSLGYSQFTHCPAHKTRHRAPSLTPSCTPLTPSPSAKPAFCD